MSFFDFLTYPLVPLGLILLTDLWVRRKDSAWKNFALIIGPVHTGVWDILETGQENGSLQVLY